MAEIDSKGFLPEKAPLEGESSHLTVTTKHDEYDHHMRSHSPFSPPTPKRGSRESSPARSEYSLSPPPTYVDAAGPYTVTYSIHHTSSHHDFRIHSTSDQCLYYVENSAWTPGKADVILFRGSDKQGCPIAGVARWSHMYSREVKIGLGDPGVKLERASDVPWETMTATSTLKRNEHTFHLPNDAQRKPWVWKRTHHVGVEHDSNSWSAMNFKLEDGQTGDVIGTFATNRFKSWSKFGKFVCDGGRMGGEEGVLMALLTVLALVERSRRRSRARRTGAGGGGGGGA